MSQLETSQILYLKEVLGIETVVMPEGPIEIETFAAASGIELAVGVRVRGDVLSARLICFVASADEEFMLHGEIDSLAEKMMQAMKLSGNAVAWVEWTGARTANGPVEALEAAIGAKVPVLLFGEETARSLLGQVAVPGQWIDWSGVRIMATHGLRELLTRPELKKGAWQHLQAVMKLL